MSRLFIDLSDLRNFFRFNDRATGMQRVQLEFARRLVAEGDALGWVCSTPYGWRTADPVATMASIARIEAGDDVPSARAALSAKGAPAPLEPGATLLFLGAHWDAHHVQGERRAGAFYAALGRRGVRLAFYLCDLVPMTRPEFATRDLSARFTEATLAALFHADFILTISEATRRETLELCAALGIERRVVAAPLAQAPPAAGGVGAPDAAERAWLAAHGLDEEDFVLCVSTLEARKNHALLAHMWLRLHRAHGARVPKLALVGRRGWLVADLMNQLDATRRACGRIVLIEGASNAEIALLYRACAFTVFPSLVEGWGLPVGESLCFGKPCAASDAGGAPEAGGAFADYFDPWCAREAEAVVSRLIFDSDYRARRAGEIRAGFRGRSWDEAATGFLSAARALAEDSGPADAHRTAPRLAVDTRHAIGDGCAARFDPANPGRAAIGQACAEGWGCVEEWGVWAVGREARIRFRSPDAGIGPVEIRLTLARSAAVGGPITILAANGALLATVGPEMVEARALVWPDDDGLVELVLRASAASVLTRLRRRPLFGLRELSWSVA